METNIASTIGNFSHYSGLDGKPIFEPGRSGFAARSFLHQLGAVNLTDGRLTYLKTSIDHINEPSIVIIRAEDRYIRQSYGDSEVTISLEEVKRLWDSARLFCDSSIVPVNFYFKLVNEFIHGSKSSFSEQEVYSFVQVFGKSTAQSVLQQYSDHGFYSYNDCEKALNTSFLILASAVAHSQLVHFFVEQEVIDGLALSKLRSGRLDDYPPTLLISVPGFNFAYASISRSLLKEFVKSPFTLRPRFMALWKIVLSALVYYNYRVLVLPAIGLGVFLGGRDSVKEDIATMYFETLAESLELVEFKSKVDHVFYHPMKYGKQLESVISRFSGTVLTAFYKDVKMFVVELSKNGFNAALVNPSDADVIWGVFDVGEYWKFSAKAAEEDFACTSTAVIGSFGINPVYKDISRMIDV
ncbi:hypothetical protein P9112_012815 [Eukaryota sp. TZLM1-RC]